ncbi:RagB/SusD domain-containing protein [Sphingobacterium allocomposti]|uniref:RagB/SusD domain-containing protein n=1 Tax=Sphingobacterium allocomposti TaxID=415956 RepID=A0A5S5DFC1_9SPHI|nr:RagB/SusD family nutrient uptake outer membrane protein [Sphingobacterium composti Yoo et al. 2007 non Ten et al. 2007]TYP94631.1 RagB/SusD domain-containing protein [Sphingobacterium composti Yoo et al. 2007 non Ten et al. 2007]
MKRFNIHKLLSRVFLCCLPFFIACDKLVEVSSAGNLTVSDDLFATENGYKSVFAGLYQNFRGNLGLTSGGLSTYMSLASDDLSSTSASSFYQTFLQNSVLSSNSVVSNFWNQAYRGIYRANLILEKIDGASFIPESRRNDYKGQALFIRAFYYFYLVQLFNDVPLALSSDFQQTATLGREQSAVVWQQIIQDLEHAENLIAADETTERSVPNKFAVWALLARVYLMQGEHDKVIAVCDQIEAEGGYALVDDLDQVFIKTSTETIWQISATNSNTAEGMSFLPASLSARPVFILSPQLLQSFEEMDLRREHWTATQEVSGISYVYPYKYKVRTGVPPLEYNVVFRFAEVLLMRAESKLETGDIDGALVDLGAVRKRAGLGALSEYTIGEMRKAIHLEKRLEYFAEWGHRWFDLKRIGDIDAVLSVVKPTWKSTAQWLPIPASQRQVNVNLTQNEGYDD